MLDLLLVNPGNSKKMYQSLASPLRSIEPPRWAGILATFIRDKGYDVGILDADCDNLSPEKTAKKIEEVNPKLVVIVVQGCTPSSSSTPKMSAVIDICNYLMPTDSMVALCGLHPSALPLRTLKETGANFVITGEGFYTILSILAGNYYSSPGLVFWDGGLIKSNPLASLLPGNELPPVAWDLLDMTKYRAPTWPCMRDPDNRTPHAVIYTSVGCPYNCTFCQIKQLYNNKNIIRFRSIDSIMDEIDLLVKKYSVKHIRIVDEVFTMTEKRVDEVCDPLIKRGYDLNMWQYTRLDRLTPKMLKKMKDAGMPWVCYSIESSNIKSLNSVHKGISLDNLDELVSWARDIDMGIMGNFIFGLPDDDLASMQGILEMMKKYLFDYVNLYTCMAYPGSQLYDEVLKEHPERLPDDWDGYSQLGYETKPLPSRYLSSSEILKFRDYAFKEYFSYLPYQEMIEQKYGFKARNMINNILKFDLKRKYG